MTEPQPKDPTSRSALNRILQLASANLPVGSYAYSQGLEWAVEANWVHDVESLSQWVLAQLDNSVATTDLPTLLRLYDAAGQRDFARLQELSRLLIASRETLEFVKDDCGRGKALARLMSGLEISAATQWLDQADTPFATLFAIACIEWQVSKHDCLVAYLWIWLEGQILAGVKLIPLGQLQGQKLLIALSERSAGAINKAMQISEECIGGSLPIVSLASALHETQYTRLFKS
ncbi:MAG: urease accessory protein UreF [Pseudomonadota bacterium]